MSCRVVLSIRGSSIQRSSLQAHKLSCSVFRPVLMTNIHTHIYSIAMGDHSPHVRYWRFFFSHRLRNHTDTSTEDDDGFSLALPLTSRSSPRLSDFLRQRPRYFSSKGSSHNNIENLDGPMDETEEMTEKERVSRLSSTEKAAELVELDRKIAYLQNLRGINTGELYTLKGKFKALARDYGTGFLLWYYAVWATTGLGVYMAIDLGGMDPIPFVAFVDNYLGTDMAAKITPDIGNLALTIAVNEAIEPIRLPIVIFTTKPMVTFFKRHVPF